MTAAITWTDRPSPDTDSGSAAGIPSSCRCLPHVEPCDEEVFPPGVLLGTDGARLRDLLDREALRPLLEKLTLREKQILVMRFHRTMTQSEIGLELNVSQMQVSRLLAAILGKLRTQGSP